MSPLSRARILLVEDDPSIARFVGMALDVFDVDLTTCSTVAEALQVLQPDAFRLIITDLMLPGESGEQLIQRLQADPGLAGAAPIAVYSAGLNPEVRQRLTALGAWRILSKPTPLNELEDCVSDALALTAGRVGAAETRPAEPPMSKPAATNDLSAAEEDAIATHFAGDATLFKAYRASCHAQFRNDVLAGDAAVAAADWPALRRLAHSLKTVLLTLGRPHESSLARQLEDDAEAQAIPSCRAGWQMLRIGLQASD